MLVLVVLGTVALLLLFAVGQLFPTKVFLGRDATRPRVMKFYGIPAAIGFVGLMVFGPQEKVRAAASAPADAVLSDSAEQDGRFKSVEFEGFTLPGRMHDAKSTGFTDCSADYYGYTCKRAAPTALLGVSAQSAELIMNGRDYFSTQYLVPEGQSGDVRAIPAEKLTYGEVALKYAQPDFDWDCVDKHTKSSGVYSQPLSCVTNKNTIAHLAQALTDAGWVMSRSKGGDYYVHPRAKVEVTVNSEIARIRRISEKDAQSIIARDTDRRAAKQSAESNAALVLEQMKH